MSKEKVLKPNFDMRIVTENVARLGISTPNSKRFGKPLVTHQETLSKLTISKRNNCETIGKPIRKQQDEDKSKQLVNETVNPTLEVSLLTGIQKKILCFIAKDCFDRGQLVTGYLTSELLRGVTQSNANVVKTSLQRLIQKGFITRNPLKKGKSGRGGFTSFAITRQVRDEVLEDSRRMERTNLLGNDLVNTYSKPWGNHQETYQETISPSSSSINNITTTNTLSAEWHFDLTPYAKFSFTVFQLQQLAALGLSASLVEQSLIEFNYDLENKCLPCIKTSNLNFLMGLLRNGHSYISESYRDEQQAILAEMAKRTENKHKKLLEERFWAWEGSLIEQEKETILAKLPCHLSVLHRAYGTKHDDVKKGFFDYFMSVQK